MAKTKSGDLRILKGEAVYGPMARDELERMLEAARFAPHDQVSVSGAPWITIEQYLRPAPAAAPAVPDRCLRVLKGRRMFPPLSRQDVVDLAAEGRIGDDDLICALDGPWMRLADFFAPPPPPPQPPAPKPPEPQVEEIVEAVEVEPMPEYAPAVGRLSIADLLERKCEWPDHWFAKVRGRHSAPMQMRHIRLLYQSGELTLDCPVRNIEWPQNDWRRIRDVPELLEEMRRY
jgi:hypothetical protein